MRHKSAVALSGYGFICIVHYNFFFPDNFQQGAKLYSLFISVKCSTCFGGYSTHYQEHTQLCLQHLLLLKPLLLLVDVVEVSELVLHPSSGAHTTVNTASGTRRTVTATCRYRGRVGTAEQFQLFHDSGS